MDSNIKNIFNDQAYKATLSALSSSAQSTTSKLLTLNFNTDGVPVFSSSKFGIWPLLCCINNLPPKARQRYILLAALWFGDKKPTMNVFLKPFIKELNKLSGEGFQFKSQTGGLERCLFLAWQQYVTLWLALLYRI